MASTAIQGGTERLVTVHERLCEAMSCPIPYFRDMDPIGELVGSLLSHRTRNVESGAALRSLQKRFAGWQDLIDAPTPEVEACIAMVRWPELKAPRIQGVLAEILRRRGELSLDFLGEMTSEEALVWLQSIHGVGPKTAAATISFSRLRMRALPVDSHHHRVAQRLGLIPPKMGEGPAHRYLSALLPGDWDAQKVYDNHEVFMLHGQKTCHWRKPACERCVLNDICPSAFQIDPPAYLA